MLPENRFNSVIDKNTASRGLSNANGASHSTNGNSTLKRQINSEAYDWLGVVLRRKGILFLVVCLAAGGGYLFYVQQPRLYESTLKLMIFTNAPPKMAVNAGTLQPTKTGKHENLLVSQLVLTKAATEGKLAALSTFGGAREPFYALRKMVTVEPVEDAEETLTLSAIGPVPTDLPIILTSVVAAYQDVLSEDEQAIGKSWVALIEKLEGELSVKKSSAETEYFELVKKLDIAPNPATKQFVNPHTAIIEEIKILKAAQERQKRDVLERVSGVRRIRNEPLELQKAIAIEATKYLQLGGVGSILDDGEVVENKTFVQQLSGRILTLESKINELRLREQKARRTYGDRHPALLSLSADVDFNSSQLSSLIEQRKIIQEKIAQAGVGNLSENADVSNSLSSNETLVIQTYLAALVHESERLSLSIESYAKELEDEELQASSIRGDIEKLNVLSNDISQKGSALSEIVDKLSELTVLTSNHTSTKVRVIDSPGVGYQVAPRLVIVMVMSLFFGGVIGFGIVALLDWTDLSYRNPEEIKDKLGLPVIARISRMESTGSLKSGHSDCLVTLERPKSAVSEAYRACRTALLFLAKQQNMKCFLITSAAAGDGKSTTAMNLAMCFAQGNLKTVIIDADLRRPRCHANLGVMPSPGLKELSLGEATVEEIVRPCKLQTNLSIVTAGKHFASPSEFIDSPQFEGMLQYLRDNFDIVIVDSPPVLPVADSLALSGLCDGVLLVLRIRKGVVLSSTKAVESLRTVSANILGVVVNQVEKMSHYSEYGKYGYSGYGGYSYYAGRYYDKQNEKYYDGEGKKSKLASKE